MVERVSRRAVVAVENCVGMAAFVRVGAKQALLRRDSALVRERGSAVNSCLSSVARNG
jgi:hypothetical protein